MHIHYTWVFIHVCVCVCVHLLPLTAIDGRPNGVMIVCLLLFTCFCIIQNMLDKTIILSNYTYKTAIYIHVHCSWCTLYTVHQQNAYLNSDEELGAWIL